MSKQFMLSVLGCSIVAFALSIVVFGFLEVVSGDVFGFFWQGIGIIIGTIPSLWVKSIGSDDD